MAVPGNKEGTFCDRCFAHVGKGEAYCPECGAPTGEATPAADSAVHGELAQANLLRLRGELDASEKALLSILRRFPNDPHAHEMLGDVCADRGEGARAIEWYELALDLAPNAPDVRRKLNEARDRIDARETAETAEQIGLPPARPAAAWWPLATSGAILLLAIVIAGWPRAAAPPLRRETVVAPTPEVQTVASTDNAAPAPTSVPSPAAVTPPETGTAQDRQLLADIQKLTEGARVQSVVTDPRGTLDVTFGVSDADDPKALALAVGKAALDAAPSATQVTLHAVREGSLVFAADLARKPVDANEPLTNVWPAPEKIPATAPEPPTGTPAETGTAPGASSPTASGTPPHTGP